MLLNNLFYPCLFLLAAPLTAQEVFVVDINNGPGTDFQNVPAAVAASLEGDFILVREGRYFFEDIVLDGRGLLIQGEEGADVTIGKISLVNLPAGKVFGARNLTLSGGGGSSIPAIMVDACQGVVWLEDIHVSGTSIAFHSAGVLVENSAQFVMIRGQVDPPFNLGLDHSFMIDNSTVHLFDCNVDGLPGGGFPFFSNPGDIALRMNGGQLFLNGSTLNGGAGGQGVGSTGDGAMGGAALVMNGSSPSAVVLDSIVQGGAGGVGSIGGSAGPDGADILQGSIGAQVTLALGSARQFELSSPIRENSNLRINASGLAGDSVLVSIPAAPGPTRVSPNWNGAGVTPLLPVVGLGKLSLGGPNVLNIPFETLPSGVQFSVFFAQANFFDTRFNVSTPSMLVILDERF